MTINYKCDSHGRQRGKATFTLAKQTEGCLYQSNQYFILNLLASAAQ